MNTELVSSLAADWRQAGVQEGDVLLLHSNLGRTLRRCARVSGSADPAIVLRSFLQALGESGTLLLPLFNFDFTSGIPFDMLKTPSQMGTVTEVARQWPGAVRTGHPVYSFAAIGAQQQLFRGLVNASGYGADSPFGLLRALDGKIGVIDLPDQNSMTFYHHIEEHLNVPYRHHKQFVGDYTDENGNASSRRFSLFVRDIERGVHTHVDPMGELLWQQGLYSGCRPRDRHGLRVISAAPMFDAVAEVINTGRAEGLLYEIR